MDFDTQLKTQLDEGLNQRGTDTETLPAGLAPLRSCTRGVVPYAVADWPR